MTELLEKAFQEAAKLPPDQQNALASLLLAELQSEREWDDAFRSSQDALAKLADEAVTDDDQDRTQELVPEDL